MIDWNRPHEFLDKEFQQITRDVELGKRYADQLAKVWQIDGTELWLLRERALILRQLTRKIGMISPNVEAQIATLSVSELESLGEALLDFSGPADLDEWLKLHHLQ